MHIIPDLPSEWSPQPSGTVLHLENVSSASPEYTQATKRFLETLEGAKCTIVSVKRIQNPGEYLKYMGLKASFEAIFKKGVIKEKELFHGTKLESIESICAHGFNRSFAAEANGIYILVLYA